MIPGFEEGLVGASAGEQRTLDLVFPDPYQAEQLAGKPVRFEVTVEAVEALQLPDVDAAFVEIFDVETAILRVSARTCARTWSGR
jgi:trigger factor